MYAYSTLNVQVKPNSNRCFHSPTRLNNPLARWLNVEEDLRVACTAFQSNFYLFCTLDICEHFELDESVGAA